MSVAIADLPVRKYASNTNGDHYKVNGKFNVVHCVRGDRLCCLDCRSNTCDHVAAVERVMRAQVGGEA